MVTITLPFKALSVNQITKVNYKQKRMHKSKDAYDLRKNIHKYLDDNGDDLIGLTKDFVDHKHCFIVKTIFYFEPDLILAKPRKKIEKRRLSSRVGDTDNYLKWTVDCVWDWIGIDDRFILDHNLKKRPSWAGNHIHVEIDMVELSSIPDLVLFL